jgi:hypothetical protein
LGTDGVLRSDQSKEEVMTPHPARRTVLLALVALLALALPVCAQAATPAAGGVAFAGHGFERAAGEASTGLPSPKAGLGFSLTPSNAEPSAVCPPATTGHMGCMAISDPTAAMRAQAQAQALFGLGPEPAAAPRYEGTGKEGGFSPSEIRSAYNIPETGTGTVAIVDAYDDPHAESDLAVYRKQYGLPECTKSAKCFKKLNQNGEEGNYPTAEYPIVEGSDGVEDWGLEISLDLDMVSAVCPNCKITLVEANNREDINLYTAEERAHLIVPSAISNSWGGREYSGETASDKYFNLHGVGTTPVTASAGDSGFGPSYPASSNVVISVGGTTLSKTVSGERKWQETAWSGSGGGCSAYEAKPTWQHDPACTKRMDNDVSAVANPESPVSVYDSYEYSGRGACGCLETGQLGWVLLGGTSVAAPIVAGIEAQAPSLAQSQRARAFYTHTLFDVTSGANGYCNHAYLCEAGEGYDGPTGWGSPDGPLEKAPSTRAITESASGLSATEATLNGYVYMAGLPTTYYFEYGPTTSYGNSVPVPAASVATEGGWQPAGQTIGGLHTLQGTYHYRLVASNSSGTVYGVDRTFTTVPWSVRKSPNQSGSLYTLLRGTSCVSSSMCMAVGESGSGINEALAEYWNGTEWATSLAANPAGASASSLLDVSCSSSTLCVAVGGYQTEGGVEEGSQDHLAEQWNGTKWTVLKFPKEERGDITGVSCVASGECIAVGSEIERWSGSAWTILPVTYPAGASHILWGGVSCTSSTACTAVGSYENASGVKVALIERWAGKEWLPVEGVSGPVGAKSARLEGVSCVSVSSCMATGSYENSSSTQLAFAEHLAGTEWKLSATPLPPATESYLSGVSCASATECIAAGASAPANPNIPEPTDPLSERWNGTEWSIEPIVSSEELLGYEYALLYAVSCLPSKMCSTVGEHVGSAAEVGLESEDAFAFLSLTEIRAIIRPYAETGHATNVQSTEASLHGVVNPEGSETKYYFEYGLTQSYGSRTSEVGAGSGFGNSAVNATVAGLTSGAEYHFRIVASSAGGISYGADETFTIQTPIVGAQPATSINETGATLNGEVDPHGKATTYHFEYGKTTSYGTSTSEVSAGAGVEAIAVSRAIDGLAPGTTYHYRVVAHNEVGTTAGPDQAFTTTSTPAWRLALPVNPAGGNTVSLKRTSCKSATSCIGVGAYKNGSGVTVALAESWSGVEWTQQTAPSPSGAKESELEGVSCTSEGACTAVGYYLSSAGVQLPLIERWNGEKWTLQEAPVPAGSIETALSGVSCASATSCTAVGTYATVTGKDRSLAEGWNGTSWSAKEPPNPAGAAWSDLLSVSCTASNACVAVGEDKVNNNAEPYAETWNGTVWTLKTVALPPTEGELALLEDISCTSSTNCEATGVYESPQGKEGELALAEHWNGTTWSLQATPKVTGSQVNDLSGVSCISSSSCTAVGHSALSTGPVALSEHWNGSEWAVQTTPNPSGPDVQLEGVSCVSAAACTAVGLYETTTTEESRRTLAEIYG